MTSNARERKACDAVLRLLEQRSGHRRAELRFPEEDGRGPPVDLRVHLGHQEYAIEHTRVEPFTDYIRTGTRFSQLARPIEEALDGTLPGRADYVLRFPLDPSLHVSGARFTAQVNALIECIRTEAEPLYQRTVDALVSESADRSSAPFVDLQPPGFPYSVTMYCYLETVRPGRQAGEFSCLRVAPDEDEREHLRSVRLRKTLSDKCPKLARCKVEGARTVLVLESDDIAFTNQLFVRMRLAEVLDEQPEPPDEIYLVETETRSWAVYPMKVGDAVQFDDGPVHFTEFDEADLSALGPGP